MTKLMQWLFGLVLILGIWMAVYCELIESLWVLQHRNAILMFPAIFALVFSVYATFIVVYRTLNFVECENAAKQLQKEIAQAQAELRIQGVLDSDPKGPELM